MYLVGIGGGVMTPVDLQQLMKRRRPLSVKEAADLLGVCTDYIYDRLGTPKGPPYNKRGRVYRLPTYDFVMWMRQTETP
jgi:hypothetical protein